MLADSLSRPNQVQGSEWTLKQEVFQDLCKRWPVSIDLFATSLNHRCSIYFSPYHDRNALGTDALLQNWNGWQAYAFPPWSLNSSGAEEALVHLWGFADHHSTLLASEAVVSRSTGSGSGRACGSSSVQRSPASAPLPSLPSGGSRLSLHAWRLSSDLPVPEVSPSM